MPKPFRLDVTKEWCEKMAELEDDQDVTAGASVHDAPVVRVDLPPVRVRGFDRLFAKFREILK